MRLHIKELELSHVLGCNHVLLSFDRPEQPVYIVQSEPDCPIRPAFCTGVQLFFSTKYASIESLSQLKNIERGHVRIVFLVIKGESTDSNDGGDGDCEQDENGDDEVEESDGSDSDAPCTSKEAKEREYRRLLKRTRGASQLHTIEAIRDFRNNPHQIIFTIDRGTIIACEPAKFHALFCSNVDYMLAQLHRIDEDFDGNWMDLLSTELNEMFNNNESMENPFNRFVSLYAQKKCSADHFLSKMTTSCVMTNIAMNMLQKALLLKVFVDTRKIFEYVSVEYTVWFLIPFEGNYVDLEIAANENVDYSDVQTFIQLKSQRRKRPYLWTNAEHAIKDLLLISFQLSIAFHCKRRVLYFRKMDALKTYQSLELSIAAHLQLLGENNINWTYKNYLQRIIDVCNKISVTAIIEFPGGLPLPPTDAIMLKCYKAGSGFWDIKVVEGEPSTVEQIADCIGKNLKDV